MHKKTSRKSLFIQEEDFEIEFQINFMLSAFERKLPTKTKETIFIRKAMITH